MPWTTFHRPFSMELDPVEINQCTKFFYPSSVPSMKDNLVISSSSSCKTTMASKIFLQPWFSARCLSDFRFISLIWFTIHVSCNVFLLNICSSRYFFAYYFCSSYILHRHACMNCENGVWSLSSLYWFSARMSRSGDGIKGTSGSPKLRISFSHPRPTYVSLSSPIVCMRLYMTLTYISIYIEFEDNVFNHKQ